MDILVVGKERNFRELNQRLGDAHRLTYAATRADAARSVGSASMIFDFTSEEAAADLSVYHQGAAYLFLNTAIIPLRQFLSNESLANRGRVYGFNGLDGFTSQSCLELVAHSESKDEISHMLTTEKIEYAFVDDRVGMVTPRIICMIINEAFYTVQEGTASRSDIDLAMKLGTNYPYGPFEWCVHIGINTVYELLDALYLDTNDERFKISPLLKKEYFESRNETI